MKTEKGIKTLGGSAVQHEPGRAAKEPAADTYLASQLQAMEKGIADASVVNPARVAGLRQAISEGRFEVNSEAVADRLIAAVEALIRARNA